MHFFLIHYHVVDVLCIINFSVEMLHSTIRFDYYKKMSFKVQMRSICKLLNCNWQCLRVYGLTKMRACRLPEMGVL